MAPLPCSPVSNSTASETSRSRSRSKSQSRSSSDSADDITPRPGPSDPSQRTSDVLSHPPLLSESFFPFEQVANEVASERYAAEGQPRNPFTYRGIRTEKAQAQSREKRRSVTFLTPTETQTQTQAEAASSQQQPRSDTTPFINSDALVAVMDAISRHSPSASPRRGLHNGHGRNSDDRAGESSADEQTAIVRRKGSSGQANYGAVPVDDDDAHQRDQLSGYEQREERSPRQRKPGSLKSSLRASNRNGRRPARNQLETPPATEHNGHDSNGWFKGLIEKYGTVELENKGSVARDHLALERTFLAWLRTSLSFASIGIAVTQLFRLNTSIASHPDSGGHTSIPARSRLRSVGKPLGATFLGISILILLLGFHRYFESQHYVIRGKFPASRGTIIIVSAVAAALIVTSLIVVVVVAPEAFEK